MSTPSFRDCLLDVREAAHSDIADRVAMSHAERLDLPVKQDALADDVAEAPGMLRLLRRGEAMGAREPMVRLGPERRLETLSLGTKVLLTCGKIATLIACNFTRAIVRLDTGAERDVAPGAELEVVEAVAEGAVEAAKPGGVEVVPWSEDVSALVRGTPEIAHSTPLGGAATRQTARVRRPGHPPASDASAYERGVPGQGARLCLSCGVSFTPWRSWQRYCSRRCRQRAYDGRCRTQRCEGPLSRGPRA